MLSFNTHEKTIKAKTSIRNNVLKKVAGTGTAWGKKQKKNLYTNNIQSRCSPNFELCYTNMVTTIKQTQTEICWTQNAVIRTKINNNKLAVVIGLKMLVGLIYQKTNENVQNLFFWFIKFIFMYIIIFSCFYRLAILSYSAHFKQNYIYISKNMWLIQFITTNPYFICIHFVGTIKIKAFICYNLKKKKGLGFLFQHIEFNLSSNSLYPQNHDYII